MAQQVFNQWAPVAKAQNEQGQEVYLPFAGIHAQTRDGKDEIIVGAGNMVWTGSMWVPVSTQNRLPVDAAVSGTVDVSDRADRQLGQVALSGSVVEIARVSNMTLEADATHVIEISQPQCRDLIITFRSTGWNTLTSGDGIYWNQIVAVGGAMHYGELRGSVIDPYQPRLWQEGSVSGGIAEVPVLSADRMSLRLYNGTGFARTFSYYILGRL